MGILSLLTRSGFHGRYVWPYNALPHLPSNPVSKMVLRGDYHGWITRDLGYDYSMSLDSVPNFRAPLCYLVCLDSGLASLDQCFCIHDNGPHGVQFYTCAEDWRDSCAEIWTLLRVAGYFVRFFQPRLRIFADVRVAPSSSNLLGQLKLWAITPPRNFCEGSISTWEE
jgi:hypothetical protein